LRHSFGLLIPLPSDYAAALLVVGPWLAAASGVSALVVWSILRVRGQGAVATAQLAPSICLDSVARLVFAEAWLGAAEEAHGSAALVPGLVYVLLLPTCITWLSVILLARWSPPTAPPMLPGVLLLCAISLVAVFSARPGRAADDGLQGASNLLLVTIDTWRFDHLSAHPEAVADGLTPRLDALAERGLLFTQARAHAPLTVPSHAAMLSGLRPWEMGLFGNSGRVPPGSRWLPEVLAREGYATGAVVSGGVLRGKRGFARGFARFHDDLQPSAGLRSLVACRLLVQLGLRERPPLFRAAADRALRRSKAFVSRQKGPWFLWMHLYDPHRPYSGPGRVPETTDSTALLAAFPDPCSYSQQARPDSSLATMLAAASGQAVGVSCTDQGPLSRQVRGYQREVRTADAAVGELLDWLEQRGQLERTAIIVTADHGESITEHGEWMSHQFSAYEPVLRVPLIVVPPGGGEARVSGALVEHRDLPRTVAEMLALRSAVAGRSWLDQVGASSGRSTVASLAQARPGEPGGSTSGPRLRISVRDLEASLVLGPGERLESYDLQADPAQIHDLAEDAGHQPPPHLLEEVKGLHAQLAEEQGSSRDPADPALDALLRLGYRE